MAGFDFTVTDLLKSIKLRAMVPESQITFNDEALLMFANEEMDLKVVPNLIKVKEEFYITEEVYTLEEGKQRYEIPYRAIGSKVREAYRLSDDQNNKLPLTRIQPEQIDNFQYSNYSNVLGLAAFYLQNNDVVLVGEVSGGKLGLSYYLRPNRLVEPKRVGIITGINTTTGAISISNITFPSNITASSKVDFLQVKPNFKNYKFDVDVISVNPTTKQIFVDPVDIPAELQVGDHIASAGECIIPQIPSELRPMLAQAVACRILEAMGDLNNLAAALKKLEEMERMLFTVVDTRTEGNPQKINNVGGLMRRARVIWGNRGRP